MKTMTTISLKISDKQINSLISDKTITQLKDIRTSLYLKFNKFRTGGTWWLINYKKGKQNAHRIGTYPKIRANKIMDMVAQASLNIERNEAIKCDRFETVSELVQWHIERESSKGTSTKERLINMRSMAENHIIPIFEEINISELTHELIDDIFIQAMFKNKYSVSYVRANFNLIKSAFVNAKKLKKITINPLSDIKFRDFFADNFSLKHAQIRGCRLSLDDMKALVKNANGLDVLQRSFLLMLVFHGSRIGETRKAKWSHISFENRTWTIPKENTKNGIEMVYPLTDHALKLLKNLSEFQGEHKNQSVFTKQKNSTSCLSSVDASNLIKKISGGEWSAHDIRKRARSTWQELGVDYIVCESLLNHARDKLDLAYIHAHVYELQAEALNQYHLTLSSRNA